MDRKALARRVNSRWVQTKPHIFSSKLSVTLNNRNKLTDFPSSDCKSIRMSLDMFRKFWPMATAAFLEKLRDVLRYQ
uniref:Uncharacterized protein n=1 Tax=Romanomermis culicivorax TaxID=13658 RepID=A0A915JDP5_ROMCU